MGAQEIEDGVGVLAVDLNLLEDRESALVLLPNESLDFSGGARLLSSELVAREGEDFEAVGAVFGVESAELLVVVFSEPSLRCHIGLREIYFTYEKYCFLAFS